MIDALPTKNQELLLQAALFDEEKAIRAWHEWKSGNDLNKIDPSSYRILPLVYRNLLKYTVNDRIQPKLKGIYRHTWYRNQLLFKDLDDALACLQKEGIDSLLLKGAALTPSYYGDYGVRPMHDLDIAVSWGDTERALRVLSQGGWHGFTSSVDTDVPMMHAISLKREGHISIDLHFHVMKEWHGKRANQDFWSAAIPTPVVGTRVLTLNPAHGLLLACVHGADILGPRTCPEIQWIADAITILRHNQAEIEWDYLVHMAKECKVRPLIQPCLTYISRKFGVSVPDEVLSALSDDYIGWEERTFARLKLRHFGYRTLRFWVLLYQRQMYEFSPLQRLRRLPMYLTNKSSLGNEGMRWPLFVVWKLMRWARNNIVKVLSWHPSR